jgi:biotin transport system substrate-specific component
VLLGKWWGGISQAIYAILGIAGVPWFAGWTGGVSRLAGPTGGYIIGFILCALAVGYFTDGFIKARKFHNVLAIMLIANFVLVYLPGVTWLGLWLNLVSGKSTGIIQTLSLGFVPFIIGDVIKVVIAAGIGWGIVPKQSYARESDRTA